MHHKGHTLARGNREAVILAKVEDQGAKIRGDYVSKGPVQKTSMRGDSARKSLVTCGSKKRAEQAGV